MEKVCLGNSPAQVAARQGWPLARSCPRLWIHSRSNLRKLPGHSALKKKKKTFPIKDWVLKYPLGNRLWKQSALQNSIQWPGEERDGMVVRNKTSVCISLGPFLPAYNKWTISAKLRQIAWASSAISRLFSKVVSKGTNSARAIRHLGQLVTDSYPGQLHGDLAHPKCKAGCVDLTAAFRTKELMTWGFHPNLLRERESAAVGRLSRHLLRPVCICQMVPHQGM